MSVRLLLGGLVGGWFRGGWGRFGSGGAIVVGGGIVAGVLVVGHGVHTTDARGKVVAACGE